jgi:hypothetical protein
LDIAQAVFERNRLQELNATCTIQSGAISFEFVKSMQRLGLIAADSLQTPVPSGSAMIPCDEFAALISIQPDGIIVRGICNPPGDGTVIISRSAPILRDRDTEKRLSNLRIISALLDNDDQSVLFTEMGDLLWRTLPLGPPPSSN